MTVRPQPLQTSSNKVEQMATQGESAKPRWGKAGCRETGVATGSFFIYASVAPEGATMLNYTAFFRVAALSVASHENSGSWRPKWP